MKLQGERLIAAEPEATWAALNDAEVLKACIAGCRSFERVADNEFLATMAMGIGPINASFSGRVRLESIVPPVSCTIAFDGQGGMAGFGKGSADVKLSAQGTGTCLTYVARAQVGGKLAQVGSRLIEGAAAKMADEFFTAFDERLSSARVPEHSTRQPAVPTLRTRLRGNLRWIAAASAVAAIIAYLAAA